MDAEDLRRVMRRTGVALWTLIEAAIDVAARDHGKELRARRDGIVERLYATLPRTVDRCGNCARGGVEGKGSMSPAARKRVPTASPPSMNGGEREGQDCGMDYDRPIDEQTKILAIKDFLEDPDQSEDSLVSLLQNLADMEITFQALKETDIGRIVNGFRKHPSVEVRQLVKQLVRRWKDLVDEWVKSNSAGDAAYITYGDSPQQIPVKNNNQNGHQQIGWDSDAQTIDFGFGIWNDRLDGRNGSVLRISDPARRGGGKDRKERSGATAMDAEDLRRVMRSTGVDLWTLIEAAIDVAARDHGKELRARRDGIVERLYATLPRTVDRCGNCARGGVEGKGSMSPAARKRVPTASPPSMNGGEREGQDCGMDYDRPIDEQTKILAIKDFLEDPDQSEDSLVSLLQNLADMEITFQALKETDIGRIVNGFRKHPSVEVRQLVKQLVRRWKDLVDEWVKSNSAGDAAYITYGDSPQQIPVKNNNQNGHQQAPEFCYSTNPHSK
ncbi:hypothetical protein COCNU_scaffold054061G000010 [Cocos nucifera]|nr:hypothetical protein [Cocos nucifera]